MNNVPFIIFCFGGWIAAVVVNFVWMKEYDKQFNYWFEKFHRGGER